MENYWVAPVAVAALALTGMFGIAWQFRAHAARRWLTAWDAYAERELAQERRRKVPKGVRTLSTALALSGKVRAPATAPGRLSNKKSQS